MSYDALAPRQVIVGVCGGIAAYKMATLVSRLVQRGDAVHVLMTVSATQFVGARTFESLSGRKVLVDTMDVIDDPASQHVAIARRADLMIIAPCTMNTLARLATGFADDAITLTAAAIDRVTTPVLLAPAMNDAMWRQPAVQRNLDTLASDGFRVLPPDAGWQACRTEGQGRLPEPDALLESIDAALV